MSREIKFRTWSESDRCYRPDLNKLLTYGKSVVYSDEGDRFDIEQFTGLLDRNGKEIYEGDIVKVIDAEMAHDRNKFFGDNVVVKQSLSKGGAFVITNWYGERILDWDIPLRFIEVIGNIHENPELLGGENE